MIQLESSCLVVCRVAWMIDLAEDMADCALNATHSLQGLAWLTGSCADLTQAFEARPGWLGWLHAIHVAMISMLLLLTSGTFGEVGRVSNNELRPAIPGCYVHRCYARSKLSLHSACAVGRSVWSLARANKLAVRPLNDVDWGIRQTPAAASRL